MVELDPELSAKQEAAVQLMLLPEADGAALLAFDMGLGKTRTALMFARERGDRCILAVVPQQTMDSWTEWAETEYPELPVSVISSSKPGQKALASFTWRADGIYLITPQYWERKAWRKVLKKKRRKTEADKFYNESSGVWSGPGFLFIFDESHRSCSIDSGTHGALRCLDPRVFKLSMSGTPFGDGFDGAYGATKWLWPHRVDVIPHRIQAWRKEWAETVYHPFAPDHLKVVGEKVPGAFVSALPCYIREESNMPEAVPHTVWVDLYPEQRRIYDELDNKMVAWIEGDPLVAEYSITKRAWQRQTTLATPTLTFDEETGELTSVTFEDDAESVKTDCLVNEISGSGTLKNLLVNQRLLILTDSQKYARLLTARLNKEFPNTAVEWSGKVTQKRRAKLKADYIAGDYRFIVGVYAAMGVGTDELQYTGTSIVVSMSLPDYRITKDQGIARLNLTGQTEEVQHVSILARDTVDTGQISKQLDDAIKAAKMLRKKERERKREEERHAKLHIHNTK